MPLPNSLPVLQQPDVLTDRQERVAELRLHGHTYSAIGKQMGINRVTVASDMRKVVEHWRQRAAISYEAHVAERLARLDQLATKLEPGVERGDWKAIDTAIRLEDRAAKLLGIDAPVKQEIHVTVEAIDEEIRRLEHKAAEIEPEIYEAEIVDDPDPS